MPILLAGRLKQRCQPICKLEQVDLLIRRSDCGDTWRGNNEPTTGELPKLADLYPSTQEGLEAMNAAIAEHGSGKALAVHLGNTSSNPARWI